MAEPRCALSGDLCQVTMGSTDLWDPEVEHVIKGDDLVSEATFQWMRKTFHPSINSQHSMWKNIFSNAHHVPEFRSEL